MHALYDLRDVLCKELEEYGKKGELSAGTLDIVDKLTHTIKNLDKIIEANEDGGYSNEYSRKRDSMGRYSRRYSRTGDIVDRLKSLANDAPDDRTRSEIHNLVSRMEMM